jgi:enamine deaminase RidA (YjgF/YER057c/UK114 family)
MGARRREDKAKRLRASDLSCEPKAPRMVFASARERVEGMQYSFVDLGDSARVTLMLTPHGRGSFHEQTGEVLRHLAAVLEKQPVPMTVTVQTVFLRDEKDRPECERLLAAHFGEGLPITSFVLQPPCAGAALALEAWAIGGPDVRLEHFGPQTLAVSYDSVRWVYCGGISLEPDDRGVWQQTTTAMRQLRTLLAQAGSGVEHVVRTWFYLGGITEPEGGTQRYKEFNRARTDSYHDVEFCSALSGGATGLRMYPASTGIGMGGRGLVLGCHTLQTTRPDARMLALENPQQVPAYSYGPKYSPQSPKFSRAIALLLGDYVTTWISGTASIVNSESCHPGDVRQQTEQTIDNIESLIAADNFAAHGVPRAGARLQDLAKVRVYLKRAADYAACKAICERRFGPVPAIYAVADVCRPELLVEIEGVAFSRRDPANAASAAGQA